MELGRRLIGGLPHKGPDLGQESSSREGLKDGLPISKFSFYSKAGIGGEDQRTTDEERSRRQWRSPTEADLTPSSSKLETKI